MKLKIIVATIFTVCMSLSICFGDDSAREFFKTLLQTRNTEKFLNAAKSAITNRRVNIEEVLSPADPVCEEPCLLESLPEYTEYLSEGHNRGLRELDARKFHPICHLSRKIRRLNTKEFEYRPAYYEEVKCQSARSEASVTNEVCSSLGFSCVQWNKTIHFTRRRYDSDCWETRTIVIPAGCECMWPMHTLGDIMLHI